MSAAPATRASGLLAGLLAAFAFGAGGPVAKPLLEAGWSPLAAVFARVAIGAIVLAVPVAVIMRGRWLLLIQEWRLIVAFGATGVAGSQLLYFSAIERLPVAVAHLLMYTAPMLLVLLVWARTRHRPSTRVLLGCVAGLGGLMLVIDLTGVGTPDGLGVMFAMGGAVCTAAYFLICARPTRLPPLALAGAGMAVAGLVLGVIVVTGMAPADAPAVTVELAGVAVAWFVPTLIIGTVAGGLAYAVGVLAISLLGSRLGSFIGLLEVLFAVLLAWLIVGEQPSASQLVGGAFIVAGVVLVRSAPDAVAEAAVRAAVAEVAGAETAGAETAREEIVEGEVSESDRGSHV